MSEHKPCPFCGSCDLGMGCEYDYRYVVCANCQASGPWVAPAGVAVFSSEHDNQTWYAWDTREDGENGQAP